MLWVESATGADRRYPRMSLLGEWGSVQEGGKCPEFGPAALCREWDRLNCSDRAVCSTEPINQ